MLPEWTQRGGLIEYFQPSNLELASGWDEISFLPCRTSASFPVTMSLWRHLKYVVSPWLKFGCTEASSLLATVSGRSFTCPGDVGLIYDKFFYLFIQFTDSVFKTTWQFFFTILEMSKSWSSLLSNIVASFSRASYWFSSSSQCSNWTDINLRESQETQTSQDLFHACTHSFQWTTTHLLVEFKGNIPHLMSVQFAIIYTSTQ